MWVTGVIPLHNHQKWICQAIDSMVNQTVKPQAIVVVDDGSTDGSAQTVKDYVLSNNLKDYVHLLSSPTAMGPSAARNAGIKLLWDKTDIFALLDSDDWYTPKKIELSLREFEKDPNVGIVYSDYTTFNEQTGLRLRQYKPAYSRELLMKECHLNSDSLFLKNAFNKVGLYDQEMRTCEDYDIYTRITEYFMAVHIPLSLVEIRVGSHSSSDQVQKSIWTQCYQRVFTKLNERLHNRPNK